MKRVISLMTALAIIFVLPSCAHKNNRKAKAVEALYGLIGGEEVLYDRGQLPVGSSVTDWIYFTLALSGREYKEYLAELEEYITSVYNEDGCLSADRSTEYHRTALAILALGGDPTHTGTDKNINLIRDGTSNFEGLTDMPLNSVIYALITLNSRDYDREYADKLKKILLNAQNPDGSWGLYENSADADITAMAIQSLAPFITENETDKAIKNAFSWLGKTEITSSETVSQTIIALCLCGMSPKETDKFSFNGISADEMLESFLKTDGYAHNTEDEKGNLTATQQALLALCAEERYENNENGIYIFD